MEKFYILIFGFCFYFGNAQTVNIPDANFKAKLIELGLDANNDSDIQVSEIENLTDLDVSYSNISDLTGISAFAGLQTLDCGHNALAFLNLSGLNNLTTLNCWGNQITTLNLYNCSLLTSLTCTNNALASLDFLADVPQLEKLWAGLNHISNIDFNSNVNLTELDLSDNDLTDVNVNYLSHLTKLHVGGNRLTALQVDALTNLRSLQCWPNQIAAINVSNLSHLYQLDLRGNALTSLDVAHNLELGWLLVAGNQLTSIDVSANYNLTKFYCHANPLTTVNVSNLQNLADFKFGNSPALQTVYMKNGSVQNTTVYPAPNLLYICADESEIASVQAAAGSSITVDSSCTFTPGGTYYILHGNLTSDGNNNGCDSQDAFANTVKFNVDGNFIFLPTRVSLSGIQNNEYFIPLTTGTHSVQPVLENPTYFQSDPVSVSVNFPFQESPLIQHFCIAPLGFHPDIEVVVLALEQPRPGTSCHFKILVKNKGNQVISSEVGFSFNLQQASFSWASQMPITNTAGNLSFLISNLNLYNESAIDVILDINGPSQWSPVFSGDVLSVTANGPVSQDETPLDNAFTLNQTVVDSYDPNDKTCLEGTMVSPDKIGDYVHYMIRFENTGTAQARKVVVKDFIDTEKFDIGSLVPIDGSHPFVTKISDGNTVEFTFENINLPFDDTNNGGYVVFKIKTNPNLVVGNSFSNSASIYFDYNFPIVTNTATTTIAALALSDFEFEDYFTLYPNPAGDVLNIQPKKQTVISSVSIYNVLGQLVLVNTNFQQSKTINVSALKTGNYFIKINSDQGTSNSRFIKK